LLLREQLLQGGFRLRRTERVRYVGDVEQDDLRPEAERERPHDVEHRLRER
jgi:hypothetical protein